MHLIDLGKLCMISLQVIKLFILYINNICNSINALDYN